MAQPVLPQPHPVTGDTDQGCMRVNTRVTGTTIDIFNNMEGFNLCLATHQAASTGPGTHMGSAGWWGRNI